VTSPQPLYFTMVNKIFSATFALALLLTQVAHALPQASDPTCEFIPPTPDPLRAVFSSRFDNPDGSMETVACSNGVNGLETKFPTFGDIPSFPFIGGAFDIFWNSTNCGSCWNVSNPETGVSIQMTAINVAGVGFNLSPTAFDNLTNGDTTQNVIGVVANKISDTPCPSSGS